MKYTNAELGLMATVEKVGRESYLTRFLDTDANEMVGQAITGTYAEGERKAKAFVDSLPSKVWMAI